VLRATLRRFAGVCLAVFPAIVFQADHAVGMEQRTSTWVGAGAGWNWNARASEDLGVGYDLHLSHRRGGLLLGARMTYGSSFYASSDEDLSYYDAALLVGAVRMSRAYVASIAAGPAVTWGHGTRESSPEEVTCYHFCYKEFDFGPDPGLAVESQLLFRPARSLGIGLYLFGNVNDGGSFFGVNFCIVGGSLPARVD